MKMIVKLLCFSLLLIGVWSLSGSVPTVAGTSVVATQPDSYILARSPLSVSEVAQEESRIELVFDQSLYQRVRTARKMILSDFPISPERSATVRLEKYYVLAPYSELIIGTDTLNMRSAGIDVTLLRGEIVDEPNSFVCLAMSPIMCKGMVSFAGEQYAIGPDLENGTSGSLTLVDANEYTQETTCEVVRLSDVIPADEGRKDTDFLSLAGEFKITDVAVDTDTFLVRRFEGYYPSAEKAAACYLVSLVGLSSAIYERDLDVKHIICWLRVWPLGGPDPVSLYPYSDNPIVDEFSAYWSANMGHVDRTMACLVKANGGCGGRGSVGALCSMTRGYFTMNVRLCNIGTQDVYVYCHEAGHVHGSTHTNCYVPAIDSCISKGEPGDPCYHPITVQQVGTIMSGCAPKIHEFHPTVVDTIRNHVDNAACMRIARDPVYVDWSNTGYEDGTAAYPYNTVLEGAETVMPGGTVLIAPGNYPETPVIPYPCLLLRNGTSGTVTIGD